MLVALQTVKGYMLEKSFKNALPGLGISVVDYLIENYMATNWLDDELVSGQTARKFLEANNYCKVEDHKSSGTVVTWRDLRYGVVAGGLAVECAGGTSSDTGALDYDDGDWGQDVGEGDLAKGPADDDSGSTDTSGNTAQTGQSTDEQKAAVKLTVWDAIPPKFTPALQELRALMAWDPTTAYFPLFANNYGKSAKQMKMFFNVFSEHISLLPSDGVSSLEPHYSGDQYWSAWAYMATDVFHNPYGYIGQNGDGRSEKVAQFDIIRFVLGKYWARAIDPDGTIAPLHKDLFTQPIGSIDSGIGKHYDRWVASQKEIMSSIAPDSIGATTPQDLVYDFTFPVLAGADVIDVTEQTTPADWYNKDNWLTLPELDDGTARKLPYSIQRMEIINNTGDHNPTAQQQISHVASKAGNDIPFFQLLESRVEVDNQSDETRYKFDHIFEFPIPYSEEELVEEAPSKPLYATITPIYNFYHETYETYVTNTDYISMDWQRIENLLPNLYLTAIERGSHDSFSGQQFLGVSNANFWGSSNAQNYPDGSLDEIRNNHKEFLTLDGNISDIFVDISNTGATAASSHNEGNIISNKIGERDTQDYFTAWTHAASSINRQHPTLGNIAYPMRNQILLPEASAWSQSTYDIEGTQKMFPMMMDVRFSPFKSLGETGTFLPEDSVLDAMMNPSDETNPMWYAFLRWIINEGAPDAGYGADYVKTTMCPMTTFNPEKAMATDVELLEFDFFEFLTWATSDTIRNAVSPLTEKLAGTPTPPPATVIIPESSDSKLAQAMYYIHPYKKAAGSGQEQDRTTPWRDTISSFKTKFDQIVKKKTRNYIEVLGGKTAPFEVLFWKISKYAVQMEDNEYAGVTAGTATHLANYYFPNMPGADEIKLLDSQVKYDQEYMYNISAITIVFGTQYNYRNMKESVKTLATTDGSNLEISGESAEDESNDASIGAILEALNLTGNAAAGFDIKNIPKNQRVLWPSTTSMNPAHGGAHDPEIWGKYFLSGDLHSMETDDYIGWFTNFMDNATTARDNIYPHHFAPYHPGEPMSILTGINGWNNPDIINPDSPRFDNVMTPITNYSFTVDIISRPSVKVMEVPYYSLTSRIVDRPPIPPIPDIVPYMGVNDTFLISLDSGTGRVKEEAIALIPSDDIPIEKQVIAQKAGFPPIYEFRSDDPAAHFEIFRIDKPESEEEINSNEVLQYYPPTSYQSFAYSSFYKRISPDRASSASVREKIQPNKKYYYTFRATDVHENISNPSSVYEIRIVDDGGTVYMETNIYNFEIPENTNVKSARKYINIVPTMEQTIHADSSSDPPSLGIVGSASSIFNEGDTFKIRLTSKQSGKKLDLNINFNTKDIPTGS